jgi:predicted  nucleic acid-binding Zn-ribbon protein
MSEELTQPLPQDGVRLILARLDSIDSRLTTLEDKVERRLQDTRPIWEQVLVRLEAVEGQLISFDGRMVSFGSRMDGFETRLDDFGSELRSSLRSFERQVGQLAEDVLKVRADQRGLEKRMDEIESKAT